MACQTFTDLIPLEFNPHEIWNDMRFFMIFAFFHTIYMAHFL